MVQNQNKGLLPRKAPMLVSKPDMHIIPCFIIDNKTRYVQHEYLNERIDHTPPESPL